MCSQELSKCPCPGQDNPIHTLCFLKIHLNIILPSKPISSNGPFPSGFLQHNPAFTSISHTSHWNYSPYIHQYGSIYGHLRLWESVPSAIFRNKYHRGNLPLKEILGRHPGMSCPRYTTANLVQFVFFKLVSSVEMLLAHLFVIRYVTLPTRPLILETLDTNYFLKQK